MHPSEHSPAARLAGPLGLFAITIGGMLACALDGVRRACESDGNIMEAVIAAVRANATLGEICHIFREIFGQHRDPAYV